MPKPYKRIVASLSAHDHRLYKVDDWHDYNLTSSLEETDNPANADIITSEIKDEPGRHTIMLDLDVPAKLVPSSTKGHSHLYIDVSVSDGQLWKVMTALVDAGVVQTGYARVSRDRGFTALRLPWVKKEEPVVEEAAF